MVKITIFGLAGTGTSSVGKVLAKRLGYDFVSSGNVFREMAKEHDMTIYEFDSYAKSRPDFDLKLDKRIENYGKGRDDFVVESRLAWHFIPDSVKIKLVCDFDERMRRVIERDGGEFLDVERKTLKREADLMERFSKYYRIEDYTSEDNFDMIVDTSKLSIDDVCKKIEEFLKMV